MHSDSTPTRPRARPLRRRRALWLAIAVTVVLAVAIVGAASISRTRASDAEWLRTTKLVSKKLVVGALTPLVALAFPVDPKLGPPTPLDGPGFFYENLEHPYLERIRNDPRLANLYDGTPPDVEWAAEAADFLRDRFPHGTTSFDPQRTDVLELLDVAEQGEPFLCGTASKMLIQLVQAGGGDARKVRLGGHVVVEIWSPSHAKWVLVDPDVNVRYEDVDGNPLNALDMLEYGRAGARDQIVALPGASKNGLFSEELLQRQLPNFYADGFAIEYHAKWLSLNLPRWHPRRSPTLTSVYYEPEQGEGNLYFDHVVHDPSILYLPPNGNGASPAR